MTWNDRARIECQFTFQCPRLWQRLEPTMEPNVRYCLECRRDVYLARTEQDLRRLSEQGRCLAVPVLRTGRQGEPDFPAYVLGRAESPYNPFLRRLP